MHLTATKKSKRNVKKTSIHAGLRCAVALLRFLYYFKIFIYYIYAIRVYKKLAEFKKTATALRATFSIVTTKGTTNMNEQKYCPLSHESGVKGASWCALYDEAGQSCAIMNISTTLDTIADKLDGIDETLYTQEEGR